MMDTAARSFATLADLLRWCRQAPPRTRLDAQEFGKTLDSLLTEEGQSGERFSGLQLASESAQFSPNSWRERLWTVPAETRLGVQEVAEALGRPRSSIYARTGPKAEDPLPHRKLDGTLLFTAGELRAWIRDREDVVAAGPMESTNEEKRGKLHAL